MPNPSGAHYCKTILVRAEMAIAYAQSKLDSYKDIYKSQLRTDCLLLRRMLSHEIDATVSEVKDQIGNIVDQCVYAEGNM